MADLFGRSWSRSELQRHTGNARQTGGVRLFTLSEGAERGVECAELRSGSGLSAAVLLTRGMSIGEAEWRGVSLGWVPPEGFPHPSFLGAGSERGGLLTSCGMRNVGPACMDEGESHPENGRLPCLPAYGVSAGSRWEGDSLIHYAQGSVLETGPGGERLVLTRRVSVRAGDAKLRVVDLVENAGYAASPFMYMYLIRIGFPALEEGAELAVPALGSEAADDVSEAGIADRYRFGGPEAIFSDQKFFHEAAADENRHVWAGVLNKRFNGGEGIGVYARYHRTQFPHFMHWKRMGEGSYSAVIGLGNCRGEGARSERAGGSLSFIEAGGRRRFETELGVLSGQREIEAFEERAAGIRRGD